VIPQPAAVAYTRQRQAKRVINVAHVIVGLGTGGAELMLLKLLRYTDRATFTPAVYSLRPIGDSIPRAMDSLGITVTSLGMRRELPDPTAIVRLATLLRSTQPDLVQTWMYHADFVGGIAAKLASRSLPVVWNLRATNPQAAFIRPRTRYIARMCARMSGWLPEQIICCSNEARRVHSSLGYRESKIHVIPNGFDVEVFRPDWEARSAVRAELGIPDTTWVIGMVARFDPHKDHRTFINAAAMLLARHKDVRFVLCGPLVSAENRELREWIDAAGLGANCHLLGVRHDVARVTAALDIATLSSAEEGFPNVLGEAMACGVPCVATDVGDSAYLIGDTGRIVPRQNPEALAGAWYDCIAMGRPRLQALGQRARRRIEEEFSIETVARAYEDVYRFIASA